MLVNISCKSRYHGIVTSDLFTHRNDLGTAIGRIFDPYLIRNEQIVHKLGEMYIYLIAGIILHQQLDKDRQPLLILVRESFI